MHKFADLPIARRIIIVVAIILVACLILGIGFYTFIVSLILRRHYEPELIISSPDGQYELVIHEWTYTVGGGAEIYVRKPGQDKWYNSWRQKKIGDVNSDCFCFTQGHYSVEWNSDNVTIYYYNGYAIEDVNDCTTWRGILSYDL